MDVIDLFARLLLTGIFVVSAVAKLADLAGSRKAIMDFGVPIKLAPLATVLIPMAELIFAFLLLPTGTARWGSMGALALLLIFIVAIGVSLARGQHPDCHCFGQLHSAPIGWSTLWRNALLTACASFVVWHSTSYQELSLLQLPIRLNSDHRTIFFIWFSLVFAVIAQSWIIFHLFRQQGRLLLMIDNLELRLDALGIGKVSDRSQPRAGLLPGSAAPPFTLPLLSGGSLSLEELREPDRPLLLLFSDPQCNPCNALLPDVAHWQKRYASVLTIALVSRGSAEDNRAKVAPYELQNVMIQQDREIAETYHAPATPTAVIIDSAGLISAPAAVGPEAIAGLVSQAIGERAPVLTPEHQTNNKGSSMPPGLTIGENAPTFQLPDLNGQIVALEQFKGHKTLVLFWNPSCGFCQRMLSDLQLWERERSQNDPQLLVVSTGTKELHHKMNLTSPVVLASNYDVLEAYGATGTPSAVLIDTDGKVDSSIAVGAKAVLMLATEQQYHSEGQRL